MAREDLTIKRRRMASPFPKQPGEFQKVRKVIPERIRRIRKRDIAIIATSPQRGRPVIEVPQLETRSPPWGGPISKKETRSSCGGRAFSHTSA